MHSSAFMFGLIKYWFMMMLEVSVPLEELMLGTPHCY